MDDVVLAFIKDNLICLGLAIAILKAIAVETPWAMDDKIIEIFSGFINRGATKTADKPTDEKV